MQVLLSAPPATLTHVLIHMTFFMFYDWQFETEAYPAMHALNCALLERVLDRHPHLEVLDIQFEEKEMEAFRHLQRVVRGKLPERIRHLTHFALKPKFGFSSLTHPKDKELAW